MKVVKNVLLLGCMPNLPENLHVQPYLVSQILIARSGIIFRKDINETVYFIIFYLIGFSYIF